MISTLRPSRGKVRGLVRAAVLALVAIFLCASGNGETFADELKRRSASEGLALISVQGMPVTVISLDGTYQSPQNPRDISTASIANGGAVAAWHIHYLRKTSPWFCSSPLIIESHGAELWRLPGDVINAQVGVSPDGRSIAFWGTYQPPDSGRLNTGNNWMKWTTGLQFASNGKPVQVILSRPTPHLRGELPEFPVTTISWSPSGAAFVYDLNGKVNLYDLAQGRSEMIASGSGPEWSPDGRWISFRSPDGLALALDPLTRKVKELFGHRRILAGIHWSPDAKYVMFSEKVGFWQGIFRYFDPFAEGETTVVRVHDNATLVLGELGIDSSDDHGFTWVSDLQGFLKAAEVRPRVDDCE
jgi:WD40 repeat protein